MIHELADVQCKNIPDSTNIWQFCVVLENSRIGENCNINCHVFIENDVVLGDNVTIKSGVQLWDGITIKDNVFVGPNVTFTNDKKPRSKKYPDKFQTTILNSNCSIGAGSIILGGVSIGEFALVGAGSIVTKSVPDRALVIGNPARIVSWLNEDGTKMEQINKNSWKDNKGMTWQLKNSKLVKA